MNAVIGGFAALVAVIAVGWIVGRAGILGPGAGGVLSRLSYFVATPALLLLTLAKADPAELVSAALVATAGSALLSALLYAALARWRWRSAPAALAVGGLASGYVNAGNLGVPIAAYVLGDASFVAPVLLFQVLVMAPIGLAVLAGSQPAGDAPARWRLLTQPLRTPVVVGCGLGVLVAATGLKLPPLVLQPIELTAALAVPAALLAYGMSLHGAPRPASGDGASRVWLAVALKTLAQPALAYALGRWAAGLSGVALLAVTVTSALPTAQNVFVYASSYDRDTLLARDTVLLTTVLSVPVLVGLAVLLGGT
ncbi:AEC family transporter [Micromonospora sp. DR5-3]|uniref:AEC family transporter n=1 Tax=unclassified Micromonospora TaxID=2617518 RepID=UPI0011DC6A6F|nr:MULTISPECIES: AEC family transporter [unclassified Micromonospora]MCW3813489.1 AEC family transporter [Micromonospora sp. DR5-3]TYC24844.1 AEC family transporter [Micromonospora sp. MP36]